MKSTKPLHLIVPLTKSPWQRGRIGRLEYQDWYRGLIKAITYRGTSDKIAIISGFKSNQAAGMSEIEFYREALEALRFDPQHAIYSDHGLETTSQIRLAHEMARALKARLVIVSTWTHYLRVRWIARGINATHVIAWGLPRPRELLTDILLTFVYPIIEIAGAHTRFIERVHQRRREDVF